MSSYKPGIAEWRKFWFLPLIAALGYATGVIHVYSLGPFIEPLQNEFGWSRAQISSGVTIAGMIGAVFSVPMGMLIDRIGPRNVALIGMILMTSGYALLGTATGDRLNWVILWIVVAIGTLWMQATVWTSAVASRFDSSRGLALAVTLSGASVAAAIFPLMATWLIENFGWRVGFSGLGGIWACLVFPMIFFFFRGAQDKDSRAKEKTATPAAPLSGISLAEGLRSPTLYKLLLASSCFTFITLGTLVHFVPILTAYGATPLSAASIASLIGIFSIIGRLGTGVLLDRFPGHIVGSVACFLPVFASVLILFYGSNPVSQILAAMALGLTLGAEVDVLAYLASKHFGLKNFGALYGSLVMAMSVGTAFGPLSAGLIYDLFGSYSEFLKLAAILMAVSSIAMYSVGPEPPPETLKAGAHEEK